jgi:hypothetical protein
MKEETMLQTERNKGAIERMLRVAFWSVAALALLAPLVAMRFTEEVRWDGADFLFAGILIGAAGIAFEATLRKTSSWAYRFAAGFAVAAAFMIVWANAAVGMIGDGENIYTLLFLGVVVLAIAGAAAARFRALRMAKTMAVAGVAHLLVALAGASIDPKGAVFSAGMALLWLISAALFRAAARDAR